MNAKQNRDAQAFLKHAQKDMQIREQMEQINQTGSKRLAEIVRIATAAGFNFTTQEYEAAEKTTAGRQCTDERLISAAGCMN